VPFRAHDGTSMRESETNAAKRHAAA